MNKKVGILYLCIMWASIGNAQIGCMDNSKHTNTKDGYDYKRYHYVRCTCPCDRYFQSFKRGRCERCLHYHAPKDIVEITEPPEFR